MVPLPATPNPARPQHPDLPGSELSLGDHLQGELDPVAESSEEAEAASGSSEPGPVASQDSAKLELLGPEVEAKGQGLESR